MELFEDRVQPYQALGWLRTLCKMQTTDRRPGTECRLRHDNDSYIARSLAAHVVQQSDSRSGFPAKGSINMTSGACRCVSCLPAYVDCSRRSHYTACPSDCELWNPAAFGVRMSQQPRSDLQTVSAQSNCLTLLPISLLPRRVPAGPGCVETSFDDYIDCALRRVFFVCFLVG